MRLLAIIITLAWVINEVVQFALLPKLDSAVLKFLIFHLSSFYGAIIFGLLILNLEMRKILFLIPILFELLKFKLVSDKIDWFDMLFSLFGILFVLVAYKYSMKKKQINIEHIRI